MSESPTQYQEKNSYGPASDERGYAQSIMFQMLQIGELADMEQTENRKRSPIVRDAIDLYYQVSKYAKLRELQEITSLPMLDLVLRAVDQLHSRIQDIQSNE